MNESTLNVPWFDSPQFSSLLSSAPLNDDDRQLVEEYGRNGLLVFDPGLDEALLDNVQRELANTYPDLGSRKAGRVQDAWTLSPSVQRLASHPAILDRLAMLYRRDPIPFQTLNFEVGTQQRTHADTIHFQSYPQNWMAGVWVALEDITEFNGPLHYVPGSHLLPPLLDASPLVNDISGRSTYGAFEDYVDMTIDALGLQRQTIEVPRGHAVIWSANVLHGGNPILDRDSTRRSQVTHYYFPGATYYTPLKSDVFAGRIDFRTEELKDIRTGKTIQHEHNGVPFTPPLELKTGLRRQTAGSGARTLTWFAREYLLPPAAVRLLLRLRGRLR